MESLDADQILISNDRASAYFEDYLFRLIDELSEVNVKVAYQDVVLEQVPATDTTIYTVPSTVTSAQIKYAVCNATVTDTLTINVVQSGDIVAGANQYITTKAITAGTTSLLTEIVGLILETGDFISADAVTATRLNLKIGIKEYLT